MTKVMNEPIKLAKAIMLRACIRLRPVPNSCLDTDYPDQYNTWLSSVTPAEFL